MKIMDGVAKELTRLYEDAKISQILEQKNGVSPTEQEIKQFKEKGEKTHDYIFLAPDYSISLKSLREMRWKAERTKTQKFHIIDVAPIKNKEIPSYTFGIGLKKKGKDRNKFSFQDMTGVFKICFSDGTFLFYAKWFSGAGKTREVEHLFATEKKIWEEFLKMLIIEKRRKSKPKNGVFRIQSYTTPYGRSQIEYTDISKKLPSTPVIHQSIKEVREDISYYYANVDKFTSFNRPGVRKGLMVGEPGTGKSSLCMTFAREFMKNMCVVFTTSIGDLAQHAVNCAKHKVSTLVLFEDVENQFSMASAELLNFLDGVDQPRNPHGIYILMTTNNPKRIEPRIVKRPGRIDKIFLFGALNSVNAMLVAQLYFKDVLFFDDMDKEKRKKIILSSKEVFNGMTGAQIKGLSEAVCAYAASSGKSDINVEMIKKVKKHLYENLKKIDDMAAMESLGEKGFMEPMGFNKTEKAEPLNDNDFFKEVSTNEELVQIKSFPGVGPSKKNNEDLPF